MKRFIPLAILISALLPYLPGGLRLEHLVVPLTAVIAVFAARSTHFESAGSTAALLFALVALALTSSSSWETGLMADPLSYFVRLAMPALMFLAFPTILSGVPDVLLSTAKAITGAAIAIVIFTLISPFSEFTSNLLKLWVQDEDGSVFNMAQDVGRNTAIFNQPLEAGIFFSIALIAVVHVWRFGNTPLLFRLAGLAAAMVGGVLCLSKNFIVLGTGCAILYSLTSGLFSWRSALALAFPVILLVPPAAYQLNENYFQALEDLYLEGGFFAAATAGRFGLTESEVSRLFTDLWLSGDWVSGRGLGAHLPLDSGYLEYLYQGGIVAMLGYVFLLLLLLAFGWRKRRQYGGDLLIILVIYVVFASVGGPVISANRASVALILLMCACLVALRSGRSASAAPLGAVDPQGAGLKSVSRANGLTLPQAGPSNS